MNYNKKTIYAVLLACCFLFVGCTAGPNPMVNETITNNIAGFWLGLWHGMIAVITFIISLFSDNVGIYEVHNNGAWYNFGFVLGVGSSCSGTASRAKRTKFSNLSSWSRHHVSSKK